MNSNLLFLTGAGFSAGLLKHKSDWLTTSTITKLFRDKKYFETIFDEIYPIQPNYSDFYKDSIVKKKNTLLSIQELGGKILFDLEQMDKSKPILSSDVNFETIFYLIEELINFFPKDDEHSFSVKHNKQISRFYLPTTIASIVPEYSIFNYISSASLFQFKNFILDFTALFKPDMDSLLPLNKYFKHLLTKNNLRYYTLNYDDLFLQLLKLNQNENDFEKTFISNFNAGYSLDESYQNGDEIIYTRAITPDLIFQNSKVIPNCYFHIHGSILYSEPTDFFSFRFHIKPKEASEARKNIGNSTSQPISSGALYDNNYMITGYDKDLKLNKEPHSSILKSFFLDSFNANEVVVCGYSFLDSHVNSIIKYVTNSTKTVHIIDFKSSNEEQQKFIKNALMRFFEGEKKRHANYFCHNKLPHFFSGSLNPTIEFELNGINFKFYFEGFIEFVNKN